MFENKTVWGIHYSRFIASWINELEAVWNRGVTFTVDFEGWLRQLENEDGEHLPEEVIKEIVDMKETGKLELENDIRSKRKFH